MCLKNRLLNMKMIDMEQKYRGWNTCLAYDNLGLILVTLYQILSLPRVNLEYRAKGNKS